MSTETHVCPICDRSFKSGYALRSHQNWHDPNYALVAGHKTPESKLANEIGVQKSKDITATKLKSRIDDYNINPSNCKHCLRPLDYNQRYNKFCNRSCSASFNNARRDSEYYLKHSNSLKITLNKKKLIEKETKHPSTKVFLCVCKVCF